MAYVLPVSELDLMERLVPDPLSLRPVPAGAKHLSDGSPIQYSWTSTVTRDRHDGVAPQRVTKSLQEVGRVRKR